ncbi:MAG: acyl-CoA thioesterase, partial [Ruminococcus sp.]|nr:acyl-CoA thioesterase [Ruminococcus sp.]
KSYVENLSGEGKLINKAYLVMVALDENEKPVEVPRLILETDEERAEWESARKRDLLRKQRHDEKF